MVIGTEAVLVRSKNIPPPPPLPTHAIPVGRVPGEPPGQLVLIPLVRE
jgi:hypothetical protein